jgi:hypothetical protein
MLKKCLALLFFIAQASIHAADQTNKAPQSINIDIRTSEFQLQSTISMPIPGNPNFAELQTELNKVMSRHMRIENGLRHHDVDYDHPNYDLLIDAYSKVKDSKWCRPSYGCNLIAFLPRPSITERTKPGKGIV